jgi:DNA-binding response OmpR family regulator
MAKILIIDDAPNLDGFLKEILQRRGYVVHTSSDDENGYLLFKNQKPDIIFIGIRDQRSSKWNVIKKIHAAVVNAPIIALLDSPSKELESQTAEAGCTSCIFKGLKPEELVETVLKTCEDHAPLSHDSGSASTKGRILVVDDEEVVRTVLSRFLKGKGYDVVTAVNGKEALDRIKKERPHLMLLDIRMPEMDGFEVLRRVHEVDREIAVMMITANTDIDEARKTMEMGACDYIVKPFHLDYLETTVMAKLLMVTA